MPDFKRVRDEKTGHEYSTTRVMPGHKVLSDKEAVDRNGEPLPAKHRTNHRADTSTSQADETSASEDTSAEAATGKGRRSSRASRATDKEEE